MIKVKNTKQTEKAETSNFKGFPMIDSSILYLGLDQHRQNKINCDEIGAMTTINE